MSTPHQNEVGPTYGPTVYATLMEKAVGWNFERFEEGFRSEIERMAARTLRGTQEGIRDAYIAGVAEGFREGVAAECKRRDESDVGAS